jgi:hypothetical protein
MLQRQQPWEWMVVYLLPSGWAVTSWAASCRAWVCQPPSTSLVSLGQGVEMQQVRGNGPL